MLQSNFPLARIALSISFKSSEKGIPQQRPIPTNNGVTVLVNNIKAIKARIFTKEICPEEEAIILFPNLFIMSKECE